MLESGPLDLPDVDVVSNAHDLAIVWARYSSRRRDSVMISTPGYSTAFPDEYATLPKVVHRLVERVNISKNTYRRRAQTWVSDVLVNIPLLQEGLPILSLEGAYKGVPAFIIGAGPSLDKNVALLAKAHQKGIIFATNSECTCARQTGRKPPPHLLPRVHRRVTALGHTTLRQRRHSRLQLERASKHAPVRNWAAHALLRGTPTIRGSTRESHG